VASDGSFDITTTATFAAGDHALTATQTNGASLTSASSSPFDVTSEPPAALNGTAASRSPAAS
jgi:hypothetical protein